MTETRTHFERYSSKRIGQKLRLVKFFRSYEKKKSRHRTSQSISDVIYAWYRYRWKERKREKEILKLPTRLAGLIPLRLIVLASYRLVTSSALLRDKHDPPATHIEKSIFARAR